MPRQVSQSVRQDIPLVHRPSEAIVPHLSEVQSPGSIDWTKYPRLHSRLITLALGKVLEEMEAKA